MNKNKILTIKQFGQELCRTNRKMAENDANAGPIILWLNYGCEGWKPLSFTTVKEALEANRYGNEFVITRIVKYEVKENE